MHRATIDELLDGIDSRYTLITLVSKRAREIIAGDEILTKVDTKKPVSVAIEEYTDGKIYPIYGENHIANAENYHDENHVKPIQFVGREDEDEKLEADTI